MEKFDAAGAKLIAIGVGTPDKARILADRVSDLVLNFCARRECVRSQMNPAGSLIYEMTPLQLPFPVDSLYADPDRKVTTPLQIYVKLLECFGVSDLNVVCTAECEPIVFRLTTCWDCTMVWVGRSSVHLV